MKSLAYLIPRTLILGLCVLTLVLGADPIVRYLLISNLESGIGAEVNIGRISSDLAAGKIYLRDFSVADPEQPMENLFQSDLTFIELDHRRLWDRQIVVGQAKTSHVRFGAPRTHSGNLPNVIPPTDKVEPAPVKFADTQAGFAVQWLDQFGDKYQAEESADAPVMLYAVAKSTNERWNRDFELHHQQLAAVNKRIVQLVNADPGLYELRKGAFSRDEKLAAASTGVVNPLRLASAGDGDGNGESVLSELLAETMTAIDELKRQQLILQQNARDDIEALDVAMKSDLSVKSVGTTDQEISVLPQSINDLLLVQFHQETAADAIGWFEWLKDKTETTTRLKRRGQRGVEFFAEYFSAPDVVINEVEINGEGMFANEHFHFVGHAYDLSSDPAGHDSPARFELRAQGQHHFSLDCELNQRGPQKRHEMKIQFPRIELGEKVLGTQDEMQVSLSPGTRVSGQIKLVIDDDGELSGSMDLDFSNVALVVQRLNEIAGGKEIEIRLSHQLSTLNHFQTKVDFSGSVHAPALTLKSDLGQDIAMAIDEVFELTSKNSQVVRSEKVKEFYRSRVRPLQQNIKSEVEKITGALDDQISKTEVIRGVQRTARSPWPAIR